MNLLLELVHKEHFLVKALEKYGRGGGGCWEYSRLLVICVEWAIECQFAATIIFGNFC